jgi:hypothetical protein
MLQENPDSLYASDARFGLATALIAADNPTIDYMQALHEFEVCYALYPGDRRAPQARNWIAVLKALNESSRSIEQLKQLDIRQEERRRK